MTVGTTMQGIMAGPACGRCSKTEAQCASDYPCCVQCSHTFGGPPPKPSYRCTGCGDPIEHERGRPPSRCASCKQPKASQPKVERPRLPVEPVDADLAAAVRAIVASCGANPDAGMILARTARHFDVRVDDLLGPAQDGYLIIPRHVAMYLCRELTDLSSPKIGKMFRRDHTTVLYAHSKIAALVGTSGLV